MHMDPMSYCAQHHIDPESKYIITQIHTSIINTMLFTTYYYHMQQLPNWKRQLATWSPFQVLFNYGCDRVSFLSKILRKVQNIVCDAMPYQVSVDLHLHIYSIRHQLLQNVGWGACLAFIKPFTMYQYHQIIRLYTHLYFC